MDKTFSCIIIEDDINSVHFVTDVLTSNFPEIAILATSASIQEGEKLLLTLQPDFVILDINLNDGDAFDLLSKFEKVLFKILFITAHNKYAVEAFKFSALDFLLKPLAPNSLIESVKKIINELQNEKYIVDLTDIIYIKSDNNYSTFHLTDNRKIVVSQTLKFYDEKLSGHNYFRCHQSYLVNLNCIQSIDKKNDTIQLSSGDFLPVAQSKKKILIDFLDRLF